MVSKNQWNHHHSEAVLTTKVLSVGWSSGGWKFSKGWKGKGTVNMDE